MNRQSIRKVRDLFASKWQQIFTSAADLTPSRQRRPRLKLEELECRTVPSVVVISPPAVHDDFADTDGNNPVEISVLDNDSASVGQTLVPSTVQIAGSPSHGNVSINTTTGAITYTAIGSFTGSDHFGYKVKDSNGAFSNIGNVTVVVNRPTANDDIIDTDGNNPVTVDVLANDVDPDGPGTLDASTVKIVQPPAHGNTSIDPTTGAITYTAIGSFSGTDSFRYTVTDIHGAESNPATVSIVVNRPVANDDAISAITGQPVIINAVANDTDPDGPQFLDPNTLALVNGPAHGTAIITGPGTFTYTSAAGYVGDDFFTYTVADTPGAVSNPGTVRVHVDATLPQRVFVAVPQAGVATVERYDSQGNLLSSFDAFPGFSGGASIATGDFNGDGVLDTVVGAGAGGGPHVKVFDGATGNTLFSFFAFSSSFSGGVHVATGDVNGDGTPDIIVGAGAGGGPHVKVFSGVDLSLLQSFFAYTPTFAGGVNVAAGDVNGDGKADIITGTGAGGGPHVKVFSGTDLSELQSFFAFSSSFAGGVSVTAADLNGDGRADIVAGTGPGIPSQVVAFSGTTLDVIATFNPFGTFTGGVQLAAEDISGDGVADVVVSAGPGGAPHIKVIDGSSLAELDSFFAFKTTFNGGVAVG